MVLEGVATSPIHDKPHHIKFQSPNNGATIKEWVQKHQFTAAALMSLLLLTKCCTWMYLQLRDQFKCYWLGQVPLVKNVLKMSSWIVIWCVLQSIAIIWQHQWTAGNSIQWLNSHFQHTSSVTPNQAKTKLSSHLPLLCSLLYSSLAYFFY